MSEKITVERSTLLKVDKLSIAFGGLKAVDSLSFDIKEKEIFGLIGPNGAGKTTVFNCITGNYMPERGQILFDGTRIRGLRPHRVVELGIARTFQNVRLFNDMTALDNVKVDMHNEIKCSFLASLLHLPSYYKSEK